MWLAVGEGLRSLRGSRGDVANEPFRHHKIPRFVDQVVRNNKILRLLSQILRLLRQLRVPRDVHEVALRLVRLVHQLVWMRRFGVVDEFSVMNELMRVRGRLRNDEAFMNHGLGMDLSVGL